MSEVMDVVRRRKLYFIIPFIVIATISIVGAFVLPKRYEAYTTILVQKDDILNPFVEWQKAVAMVQVDQLTLLNEILLSRSSIVQLLDSLGMQPQSKSLAQMEDLVAETRKKITTEQRGSDSFRIFYADSDPYITQRAATILSNIYIQGSLRSNQQQNESVVRFYQQKVDEYQKKFEEEQRGLLALQQERLRRTPLEEGSLRSGLDKLTAEVSENDRKLAQQQQALNLLKNYRENIDDPSTVAKISALDAQGAALYMTDLKALSVKYTDLLSRYTPRYPQVQAVRTQLIDLVEKATQALQSEIAQTKTKRAGLEANKNETMGGISAAINTNEIGTERKSGYVIVKELYDTMRQKLEAAKISKELGDRGASKYVILDAAQLPSAPTKPKKGLIIGGGAALGMIIGIAAMFVMEYYDPTVRRRQDIEVFNKPIIGYLP
jgi:polysaccharide biosynthesis transport protein